jgi:hypothetical protein
LETHSHCPACLYSPDLDDYFDPTIPQWAKKFRPKESEVSLEAALKEAAAPKVSMDLSIGDFTSENPLVEEWRVEKRFGNQITNQSRSISNEL